MAGVGEWSGEMEDLGQLLDLFDGPSGSGGGGDAAMPLKYDSPGSDGGSEAAAYAGPPGGGNSEGGAERKEETDQVLMDMSPMASSGSAPPAPYNKERKRYREKQRRLEVNDKFASLAKCVGAHRKIDRSELLQLVIDKFKDLDRENKELKEKLNGVSAAAHYYPQMAQMPQVAQVPQMPQPQMEDRAVKKAKLSHDQSAMQYGSMFGFPAYVPGAGACLIPPKPYFALMMQQNMTATPTPGFSIDEESEITHSHCA